MKNILWGVIIVMGLIILNELTYIGETSLAFIIMLMAAAIAIIAYSQIKNKK